MQLDNQAFAICPHRHVPAHDKRRLSSSNYQLSASPAKLGAGSRHAGSRLGVQSQHNQQWKARNVCILGANHGIYYELLGFFHTFTASYFTRTPTLCVPIASCMISWCFVAYRGTSFTLIRACIELCSAAVTVRVYQ